MRTPNQDTVVFGGGLIGKIANVKDKTFIIKVADNTKVELSALR